MRKRTTQVWLMGAYGNGNLGDDMLGDLARRSLESTDHGAKVFAGDYFPFQRDASHARRSIMSKVRRGDRLLIAGGGLLNDHFGHGFLKVFASLAIVLRLKGAEHSFIGIGVEGFSTRLGALLAGLAIGLAKSVSVRDFSSRRNVESIGGRAYTVPDLGWLARRHLPLSDPQSDRRSVVFSIAIEKESMRDSRERLIKNAAEKVLSETNNDVVLLAMQTSSVAELDDYTSLDSIKEKLNSDRVSVVRPAHYRELYPILQDAKVVAGFRLHAGVLGAVAGSHVVAISRSHKVREALSALPQCTVIDESETSNEDQLSFEAAVVAACSLPAVENEHLAILDEYCSLAEADLIQRGVG